MTARSTKAMGGIAAAAVALGVTQLLAAFVGPEADARTAVGSSVIDRTPGPVKEWAIQTFGMADKLVLSMLVLAVIAVVAAAAAALETRRVPIGSIAIVAAGVLGCAAVLSRAGAGLFDVVPTVVGTACGVAVLRLLVSGRFTDAPQPTDDGPDPGRRLSLVTLGFLGVGALTGVGGVVLSRLTTSVSGDRNAFALPPIDVAAPPVPPTVQPKGVALPTFITNNADFYRIDTALRVPQLSREDWQLRIHGMVDREITLRFGDLERFDVVEELVTLTCVSNPIGGDLIGNATWTGYRTRDLLAEAGIHPDADMVLSMSIDGFTAGTPVEALTDDRGAMLAVGMNGEPLPTNHGYPARLVVPGLYGYVSATKWVVDLEVTRFDRAQAYWTRLGWSARGPIKTSSRIDVPRGGQDVPRGAVTFGGVAWAQNRGVRNVEVRIDGPEGQGDWQQADLGAAYSDETWRLWSFPWRAERQGRHTITVRATDNTGAVQTAEVADPVPDGATGWHSVEFTVT
ncbi:molybdopterin-dependent oxidoreductase [Mycolicibacterium celeriflavum]|uniref:Oxidoreductase n=1 Tax=Mycolicibacterium celeriflavum TaxID=1249101 RepID=A0A1X0BWZ2_MYCCF|nr:molybdopterin-dependent oxidoreductase [Mycolicibacterium celeriflavum]MCV7240601.1 molybdopterin-dependent oxidoreductase [Mycolicibacterium celeriflavum]ORA48082.1 oxidoreductase [Mycolicibacterium celeriflavum]BBY43448.1 oxidoreductase [Mycolicibacterium celeriflavum]